MNIPLIGMFRVGTNFTRTVLELNYQVDIEYDALGWKHGLIPTFTRHCGFSYPQVAPIVLIKDPYATFVSWFDYVRSNGRNMRANHRSFAEFLRSEIIFRDDSTRLAPDYRFASPVDMWNAVAWNHLSFAEHSDGLLVRYEDMLATPEQECARVAQRFELQRKDGQFVVPTTITRNMSGAAGREDAADYLTTRKFTKQEFFLERGYMADYSAQDVTHVARMLDQSLLQRTGYAAAPSTPAQVQSAAVMPAYTIFTMANDARISDLAVLLESNARHDAAPVAVIPFDEDVQFVTRLCAVYGAQMLEPEPFWDKLGKALYTDEEYRPGTASWRYFRKFNAVSGASGDFVFLDANVAITRSLRPIVASRVGCDVIFGTHSAKGRNFNFWARELIKRADPEYKDGFNAAFWVANRDVFDMAVFENMRTRPGVRRMLAAAPEQSVLSLALALGGRRARLIAEAVPGAANLFATSHVAPERVTIADDGIRLDNADVYVMKWIGKYHHGKHQLPYAEVYGKYANAALARSTALDADLSRQLSERYAKLGLACG